MRVAPAPFTHKPIIDVLLLLSMISMGTVSRQGCVNILLDHLLLSLCQEPDMYGCIDDFCQ